MKWETIHPYFSIDQFQPRPAVYAIYDRKSELIYIGETSDLRLRFRQHNFVLARYSLAYRSDSWKDFPFSDIKIKVRYSKKFGEEAMIERRLIRRLQPDLNRRGLIKLRRLANAG